MLAFLVRDKPDPTAPSSSTSLLTTITGTLAFFSLLPYTVVRATIAYYLGRGLPWQPLQTLIVVRVIKLFLWSKYVHALPDPHAQEWELVPARVKAADAARKGLKTVKIIVEPFERDLSGFFGKVPIKSVKKDPLGWSFPRLSRRRETKRPLRTKRSCCTFTEGKSQSGNWG